MARRQPFTLAFASAVGKHLRAIDAKYHALIREKIGEQLRFEPGVETRNRKPLRQPALFGADLGDPLRPGQPLSRPVRH